MSNGFPELRIRLESKNSYLDKVVIEINNEQTRCEKTFRYFDVNRTRELYHYNFPLLAEEIANWNGFIRGKFRRSLCSSKYTFLNRRLSSIRRLR